MNEYIFYTCEGYTEPPLEDKTVENCQVLGRATGKNAEDAKENLLKNNSWIVECGFDIEEAFSEQILSEEQKNSIERNEDIREFLVGLLDKRQLDKYEKWLLSKGW